ncbi:MAG: alkaline phosphatase family protein [Acidobacteria bacterium]|nr:alkaline phosphatase family protein [Acidobacteriota bacterium]
MAFVRMLPVAWLASLYAAIPLTLLVFFLNPALNFNVSTLASLLPLALWISIPPAVFWPAGYRFLRIFARRRLRVRWFSTKYLLGFVVADLILASGFFWYNVNLLETLIPEEVALRFRVSAGLLTLATLGFLVVACTKRWRSAPAVQLGCYLAAGLLPLSMILLRGGYSTEAPARYAPELVSPSPQAPRLLLIGIEGATLDQVLPLVAQGKLPALGRLLQRGAHGRLTSFRPCVSTVAWESLLTGKLPAKHQVLDAFRYRLPHRAGEIRVAPRGFFFHHLASLCGFVASAQGSQDSKALTLVQILNRLGYPARFLRGAEMTTAPRAESDIPLDRFLNPEIPTPPGTEELRVELRQALREDEAVASEALQAWQDQKLRGLAVLLPGLDRVSHRFLRFAMPASFGDVPRTEVEKYGRVLEWYYRYLDGWIGKFISPDPAAGDGSGEGGPTLVLIVSPHGIDPLPLERRLLVALEGDRFESGYHGRAPDGLIVVSGPGVAHGKPLGKASVLDVTPSLLYYFRLPIGSDMDGHPLTRLFQEETLADAPLLLIPSYEASRLSGRSDEAPGSP